TATSRPRGWSAARSSKCRSGWTTRSRRMTRSTFVSGFSDPFTVRLMFLNGGAELGGAERSLLDILASIRHAESSWQLHLLTAADGPLIARASAIGVPTAVLPFGSALAR